jgi:predicted metal-dependent hydrolase
LEYQCVEEIPVDQLHLPFFSEEHDLRYYLEKATRRQVSLVITDNTSSVLSIMTRDTFAELRLHNMFLSAGRDVLDELAEFIMDRKRQTPLVRKFINQNTHRIKAVSPRKMRIHAKGRHHHLGERYSALNQEYFDGRISASITWGARSAKRFVAERTLGSYDPQTSLIRIHPILDSKGVPQYFLDFIIYHEMLHADMGVEEQDGRRMMHSKEFKKREQLFQQYDRALKWEKKRWE